LSHSEAFDWLKEEFGLGESESFEVPLRELAKRARGKRLVLNFAEPAIRTKAWLKRRLVAMEKELRQLGFPADAWHAFVASGWHDREPDSIDALLISISPTGPHDRSV